jgi:hypothetical protein
MRTLSEEALIAIVLGSQEYFALVPPRRTVAAPDGY